MHHLDDGAERFPKYEFINPRLFRARESSDTDVSTSEVESPSATTSTNGSVRGRSTTEITGMLNKSNRKKELEPLGSENKRLRLFNEGAVLEFKEKEEGEASGVDMVQEDNEEDAMGLHVSGAVQMGLIDNDEAHRGNEEMTLNIRDIDAYWLQGKIYQAFQLQMGVRHICELTEKVLKILAGNDDKEVRRNLLLCMPLDEFNLVEYLFRNRQKIVWCTRLARAKNLDERKSIEEEMTGKGDELAAMLEQVNAIWGIKESRQIDLEKSSREEACRSKDESDGDGDREQRDMPDTAAAVGQLNGKPQLLNLEHLAFKQVGHFMSNKKCQLPYGSSRNIQEEYEEVHVPALEHTPLAAGEEELIKVSMMPNWAQPAFEGMTQLNRVESQVYRTALFSAENILLCAPSGAGKTTVAMLTILEQIALNRSEDGVFNYGKYMIIYLAPTKELVAEVVGNLSNRLKHYGVNVRELSGEKMLTRKQIVDTHIIVTTPEKWDNITRKSGERTYTQLLKLLIIDDIHILHDNRGPVLESIVARTVRQGEITKRQIRLVGLSATLPNYEDIALFLCVDLTKGLFYFNNSFRRCPLSQRYIGIKVENPQQRFQLMNDICYEKVITVAGKHQVLIFVQSLEETAKTASAVRDTALLNDTVSRFFEVETAPREILQKCSELVQSNDLKDLLPYGFAIHHAGMSRADCQLVEQLFGNGHVQVLVSTEALLWGVSLPAHTVIIKGTEIYNPEIGAWTKLSPVNVMQMLGRAGRPQDGTNAEGIIITDHSELQYYLSVMNQQLPIESQFVSKLADQLNAEIALGTVQNAKAARNWLGYTYLFVRMLRNPTLYGLAPAALTQDFLLLDRRADLVHSAATVLDKSNLVKYNKESGYFQVTDLGRIASYYNISHGTINTYNERLKRTMGDIELCHLFSLSEEFKYVTVRPDEKMELARLLDHVPIPVAESLEEPSAKINVLLQAYMSHLELEGHSLTSDVMFIVQIAGRLTRALFEVVLGRGWARLLVKALNLCKMVKRRISSVQTPLRQFNRIPNEILWRLEKKGLAWESYYDLSPRELGDFVRFSKMGRKLHKYVLQLPKLNLAAHVQPISRTVLRVELTLTPDFQWKHKVHGNVEPFWVFVEDNDGEDILHHEYFLLKTPHIYEDHTLSFTVPISESLPRQYIIRVVSDTWVGSQSVLPIQFAEF